MNRIIRNLARDEVQILVDWASAEGWNPGVTDATAFQATDPSGFFGAFVDGVMVAGISAVAYDGDFGFIGLYICHADWRGQGHGKAVWDAAMTYLGTRTIGLDGVPEQQANYASMGFVATYQSVRMGGTLPASAKSAVAATIDQDAITALDTGCFPASRPQFLRHWIAPPNRLVVIRRDGAVAGYGVIRSCLAGSKIGPIFARDDDVALEILSHAEGDVQIDVPVAQTAWVAALAARGFTPSFGTARMYRGPAPDVAMEQVFAISSLELG